MHRRITPLLFLRTLIWATAFTFDHANPIASQSAAVDDQLRDPCITRNMIRKLKSGQFRLYSRKKNAETGKRRNLGTFSTLVQAKQHEREVQYFKKH